MVIKVQFLIKFFFILLASLFFLGCQDVIIENNDPNLSIQAGKYFYKGKTFSGKIRQENLIAKEEYITSFKDGLEEGEFIARKKDGQLLEKRFFKNGQKVGIHRSWFPNGNNRLYSEFDNGKYINDQNGNIYMNVSFTKNGASVGLPGSKICNPIKPSEKIPLE